MGYGQRVKSEGWRADGLRLVIMANRSGEITDTGDDTIRGGVEHATKRADHDATAVGWLLLGIVIRSGRHV